MFTGRFVGGRGGAGDRPRRQGRARTPRCTRPRGSWSPGTRAGPALALRAAKQAIDDGLEIDLATGLEIERLHFAGLFATEDQRTGMRSFMENGPGKATFAGR